MWGETPRKIPPKIWFIPQSDLYLQDFCKQGSYHSKLGNPYLQPLNAQSMEEKKINIKENRVSILRMIWQSRQNIGRGGKNKFLLYGYSATLLSIANYILIYFTGESSWSAIWILMALPFIYATLQDRKNRSAARFYTDRIINETWKVIGTLFIITALTILMLSYTLDNVNLGLMMPLALIYCGMGTSVTGLIIKEPVLTYLPPFGLVFAIYMLMTMPGTYTPLSWHLYFAISLVIIMVIPGHALNLRGLHLH